MSNRFELNKKNMPSSAFGKALALALIILTSTTLILLIYNSFDNHFAVVLPAEFTVSGNSDSNTFGVVLGDGTTNITSLSDLSSYKELSIPYNRTSGEIQRNFIQPKSDKIIGFTNQNLNNTNYTMTFDQNYNYNMTENITNILNTTTQHVNTFKSGVSLNDGLISFANGYSNYTDQSIITQMNVTSTTNQQLLSQCWMYQNITFGNTFIGKSISKIYLKFNYDPTAEPNQHWQFVIIIYNATKEISSMVYRCTDITNPSGTILNVMDDEPFIYSGGEITIEVSTSQSCSYDDNFNVVVKPNTGTTYYTLVVVLGTFFELSNTDQSLVYAIVYQQSILNNVIYSQPIWHNTTDTLYSIDFNVTFHLSDYNASILNTLNMSIFINNILYGNSPLRPSGYLMFWSNNPLIHYWLNFTNGTILNATYLGNTPPRSDILDYINVNNDLQIRFQFIQYNHQFTINLRDANFTVNHYTINDIVNYYTTISCSQKTTVYGQLSAQPIEQITDYGFTNEQMYIYNLTVLTSFVIHTLDRDIYTNNTISILRILHIYNQVVILMKAASNQFNSIDINVIGTHIIVGIYTGDSERIWKDGLNIHVLF